MARCIALVEDDECFGTMFVYNLQALGFDVEWFRCALDAQRRLDHAPYPDIVVLDWKLPRVSGSEMLRQIRLRRDTRLLPVVMLTCHSEPENKEHAFALGVTDFIPKSLPLSGVLSRIVSLVDIANGPAELAQAV